MIEILRANSSIQKRYLSSASWSSFCWNLTPFEQQASERRHQGSFRVLADKKEASPYKSQVICLFSFGNGLYSIKTTFVMLWEYSVLLWPFALLFSIIYLFLLFELLVNWSTLFRLRREYWRLRMFFRAWWVTFFLFLSWVFSSYFLYFFFSISFFVPGAWNIFTNRALLSMLFVLSRNIFLSALPLFLLVDYESNFCIALLHIDSILHSIQIFPLVLVIFPSGFNLLRGPTHKKGVRAKDPQSNQWDTKVLEPFVDRPSHSRWRTYQDHEADQIESQQ